MKTSDPCCADVNGVKCGEPSHFWTCYDPITNTHKGYCIEHSLTCNELCSECNHEASCHHSDLDWKWDHWCEGPSGKGCNCGYNVDR